MIVRALVLVLAFACVGAGKQRRPQTQGWSELSPAGWISFSEGRSPVRASDCLGYVSVNTQAGTGVMWKRACVSGDVLRVPPEGSNSAAASPKLPTRRDRK